MIAFNLCDREAAHRAEIEAIATKNLEAITCKKCWAIIRNMEEIHFLKSEPQEWDVKRKHENNITFVNQVTTSEFLDEYRTRKCETRK